MSVFLDTNVPMYAAGAAHPLKRPCIEIVLLAAEHPDDFVTDAEVLQEILHRYMAQRVLEQGLVVLLEFEELMRGRIEPILGNDVLAASSLAQSLTRLSARDLIHVAVMRRLGITHIVTSDRGFDGVPDIERLDPLAFETWRDSVADS